jgi:hypothetical protein
MQSLALLKNAPLDRPCEWVPGKTVLDIQQALNVRCVYQLRHGGEQLSQRLSSFDGSGSFKDFAWTQWNAAQPGALQGSAKSFVEALIFSRSVEACAVAPLSLRPVLQTVCALYGTQLLVEDVGVLLEAGYFSAAQSAALRSSFVQLCAEVRPHALWLVAGYAPNDAFVPVLAKSDGNVYKHLWEATRHRVQRPAHWQEARTPVTPMSEGDLVAKAMSKL